MLALPESFDDDVLDFPRLVEVSIMAGALHQEEALLWSAKHADIAPGQLRRSDPVA